jgi:hypothetical protein
LIAARFGLVMGLIGLSKLINTIIDLLCGLVVRVPGYRSGGPGSIPGTIRIKK